jgi:DNA-binding transcriptional regulator GbsR (MarR family)
MHATNRVHIFLNYETKPSLLGALKASLTASNARSESVHLFEQECVTLFSGFLHVLGVPKSIGGIYGLLYSSPRPLCFADIVEKLEMSKGSVSQGLAFLRQCGAIKAVESPGDRREFFEPELGLRRLASGLIQERIQPLAKETQVMVARMKRNAKTSSGAQNEFQMDRINQLEAWRRQLGRFLPVIQTILKVSRP